MANDGYGVLLPQADSIQKEIFAAVSRYPRRPQWLPEAWERIQDCDDCSNDKVFQIDFPTWFAYRALKRSAESTMHFQGQSDMRKALERLDDQPLHCRKAIAQKVHDEITPDQRDKLQNWEDMITRRKRPRCDSTSLQPETPSLPSVLPSQLPTIPSSFPTSLPPSQPTSPPEPQTPPAIEHTLLDPILLEVKNLLPAYLFGAVRKLPAQIEMRETASVVMTYADRDSYQMAIEIQSSKVERIARELFGVIVEKNAGLRYLSFGAVEVLPSPKCTLRGCRLTSVVPFFGEDLGRAIQASVTCQSDIMRLSEETQAVSLLLSMNAGDPATLILAVDLEEGTHIANRLYDCTHKK